MSSIRKLARIQLCRRVTRFRHASSYPFAHLGIYCFCRTMSGKVDQLVGIGAIVVDLKRCILRRVRSRPVRSVTAWRCCHIGPFRRSQRACRPELRHLDKYFIPPIVSSASDERKRTPALHATRDGKAGRIEQRRREVHHTHQLSHLMSSPKSWPINDQWNMNRGIMTASLVFRVASHEVAPVIADEDHDRVLI